MCPAAVILTKLLSYSDSKAGFPNMRLKSKFLSASTAAVFIMVAVMPALADLSAESVDVEAAIQQNKNLNELIANSPPPANLKSPKKAFLFSAVVPGTGEFYSGAKRGVIFTAAEIAFWTAYIVIHGRAEEIKEDYVAFVDEHILFEDDSPASSTKNWTLEDYEHATQSDNWHYVYTESGGEPIERVGKYYWDDLPEEMIDQPGDKPIDQSQSPARVEAFEKRNSTNDRFKQAKIFLGLVVLNHVISAVDARIVATMYNNRTLDASTEISFNPTISPSGCPGACLTLRRRF